MSIDKYPLGIRLRFVPLENKTPNPNDVGKIAKLRDLQKKFLKEDIVNGTSADFIHLDWAYAGIPTLRQMIMAIPSLIYKDATVFHNVAYNEETGNFILQYMPALANEAVMYIAGMFPYLKHVYGDSVKHLFKREAILDTADLIYNPETMRVENTNISDGLDAAFEYLLGQPDEEAMKVHPELYTPRIIDVIPTSEARPAIVATTTVNNVNNLPMDDDDVSTIKGPDTVYTSTVGIFSPSLSQISSPSTSTNQQKELNEAKSTLERIGQLGIENPTMTLDQLLSLLQMPGQQKGGSNPNNPGNIAKSNDSGGKV